MSIFILKNILIEFDYIYEEKVKILLVLRNIINKSCSPFRWR
ncbi:hypothetical protein AC3_0490 [Clostridium perfringens E str. JGS1987]|uniref:Uncharacterized protein n=1 Tax=Clostridium perfringens E str. JGS1987 TaxID=451755 RepID=B1BNU0_CLOPF|nr:hypothetical protein AC3_0490 [Clostridium perfringens E str. JGS1987]